MSYYIPTGFINSIDTLYKEIANNDASITMSCTKHKSVVPWSISTSHKTPYPHFSKARTPNNQGLEFFICMKYCRRLVSAATRPPVKYTTWKFCTNCRGLKICETPFCPSWYWNLPPVLLQQRAKCMPSGQTLTATLCGNTRSIRLYLLEWDI